MYDYLSDSWNNLIQKYHVPKPISESIFEVIIQQYSQKSRHYHNLEHITEMLQLCSKYQNQIQEPDNVCFTIWFHDIIYKAIRKDNEEKSAEFAQKKMLEMQIPNEIIDNVCTYILATKTHEINKKDTDLEYLLDFDLAVLGASPERYARYKKGVRQEYNYVPTFLYQKGRKKVLQNFLNRSQIYFQLTDLEENARINIESELG